MTNDNERRDRRQADRRERQDHAHQGLAAVVGSGYGYGSGDYGYRNYGDGNMGSGNMGSGGMDRDHTHPSSGSDRGPHFGKGPRNYRRSDESIRDDVVHALTDHPDIDATDIDVHVERAEVYLHGYVNDRHQKRLAADIAFDLRGVEDVYNSIRTRQPGVSGTQGNATGHEGDAGPAREP